MSQEAVDLTCGHCGSIFCGTKKQVQHAKYNNSTPYCSPACRKAGLSERFRRPKPQYGPCPTCGNMFESRIPKIFCSMACYVASSKFKEMLKDNRDTAAVTHAKRLEEYRAANAITCKECGNEFYALPSAKRRFCNSRCYRAYFAKRFDRWVASPERIALPQGFDEFLTQQELPCLVDGCEWIGHNLSLHMNTTHGITADDFKRAAGFNLQTGVVSSTLSEAMSERAPVGIALNPKCPEPTLGRKRGYLSLESKEHHAKARALAGEGPPRICQVCRTDFRQSTIFGRAKYCSKKCQTKAMAAHRQQRMSASDQRVSGK